MIRIRYFLYYEGNSLQISLRFSFLAKQPTNVGKNSSWSPDFALNTNKRVEAQFISFSKKQRHSGLNLQYKKIWCANRGCNSRLKGLCPDTIFRTAVFIVTATFDFFSSFFTYSNGHIFWVNSRNKSFYPLSSFSLWQSTCRRFSFCDKECFFLSLGAIKYFSRRAILVDGNISCNFLEEVV